MKKLFLFSLIALLLSATIGCEKDDTKKKDNDSYPPCMQEQIDALLEKNPLQGLATIKKYRYKGKKVYVLWKYYANEEITAVDENCNVIGTCVTGGVAGTNPCWADFEYLETVWKYDIKDHTITDNLLIGTWKCVGFGNSETGKVVPIEPQGCEKCYILTFNKNGTIEGQTSTNALAGEYKIYGNKKVNRIGFDKITTTAADEIGDGDKYYRAIFLPSKKHHKVKGNQLFIYYAGKRYLLFNRK